MIMNDYILSRFPLGNKDNTHFVSFNLLNYIKNFPHHK